MELPTHAFIYTPCSIRLTVGLLRGRCVVRLLAFSRCLPSLPRSLFLIAPSLACYRRLHTVALCKSVTSSRRHVPLADKKSPSSSPHLRWAQLWRFIKSDLILLVIAVAVSRHVLYMCLCVCTVPYVSLSLNLLSLFTLSSLREAFYSTVCVLIPYHSQCILHTAILCIYIILWDE